MLTTANVVVMQVFQVVCDKYNVFGINAVGNYATKLTFLSSIILNLYSL